jgi:hypothetical protein
MANPRWLDGPLLVRFLNERGVKPHHSNASLARAFRRWRAGGLACVYLADTLLTDNNLSLHDIPDACWDTTGRSGGRQRHPRREEAIIRRHNGERAKHIAAELGVHEHTINYWVREARTDVRLSE